MRSEREMIDLIMSTAEDDERIRAVYISGSRVDPNAIHDKYSDFDIVYIVENIQSFTNNDQWLEVFGEKLIMQKPNDWYSHPYDYRDNEEFVYLIQFKDGNRIDLTLVDVENSSSNVKDKEPRIILLDKDRIEGLNDIEVGDYYYIEKPSAKEFENCCNEFWWLSLYVAKGLCREELTYAKLSMERYEMDMFLKMINWKIGIDNDFSVSTGKSYKYLKRYLDKNDMDRFVSIFPNGFFEDIWDKLFKMCKFFNEIALEVATHFKFHYSEEEGENIMEYIEILRRNSMFENYKKASKEELKEKLDDVQYKVTQENATERPFDNVYDEHFEKGIYVDIVSGEPLFASTHKFNSGCGWPAFSKPISREFIKEKADFTHNIHRVEVKSKLGDSHLGHVFSDGPIEEGGLRYCINSASLRFIPVDKMKEEGYAEYISLVE